MAGSPNLDKVTRPPLLNTEALQARQLSQSTKVNSSNPLLDSLNQIVGDEALVFKLCFN